jgi:hypothetical protein
MIYIYIYTDTDTDIYGALRNEVGLVCVELGRARSYCLRLHARMHNGSRVCRAGESSPLARAGQSTQMTLRRVSCGLDLRAWTRKSIHINTRASLQARPTSKDKLHSNMVVSCCSAVGRSDNTRKLAFFTLPVRKVPTVVWRMCGHLPKDMLDTLLVCVRVGVCGKTPRRQIHIRQPMQFIRMICNSAHRMGPTIAVWVAMPFMWVFSVPLTWNRK